MIIIALHSAKLITVSDRTIIKTRAEDKLITPIQCNYWRCNLYELGIFTVNNKNIQVTL